MVKFHNPFKKERSRAKQAQQIAMNSILSTSQTAMKGGREELCSGTMNNNQKLAVLQLMRETDKD